MIKTFLGNGFEAFERLEAVGLFSVDKDFDGVDLRGAGLELG